ncbi:MAG: cation:proton antiporter, partial [Candidatus ainarchaeum sp.]|nr:cation:proton antiporter [Candidatus ainarchaeum sp.]
MDFFHQIAFVVGVTILLALLAKFFKQPLIISYIVSGIIVGPYFLNIVNNFQVLDTFSQMGIALLLFIVGLGLSPEIIKDVGKVSLISGVGQVLFTSVIGFLIALGFGFDWLSSIYIAIALTFSSTIIIMKLLSDRGDTDALYGKIAIGFLIVQDLIAMLILVVISALPSEGFALSDVSFIIFSTVLKGLVLIGVLLFIGVKILPKLLKFVSRSQELLLLFSLAWCFLLAAFFQVIG